jgi:hypothetical protein
MTEFHGLSTTLNTLPLAFTLSHWSDGTVFGGFTHVSVFGGIH